MTPHDDHDHYGGRPKNTQYVGTMFEPVEERETEAARLARDATIDARFAEFHRDNPIVLYELEKRIARAVQEAPGAKVGIRMVWEHMRYDILIKTRGQGYKLNDHFTSRYARLIRERHPEWVDVFDVRELRS